MTSTLHISIHYIVRSSKSKHKINTTSDTTKYNKTLHAIRQRYIHTV